MITVQDLINDLEATVASLKQLPPTTVVSYLEVNDNYGREPIGGHIDRLTTTFTIMEEKDTQSGQKEVMFDLTYGLIEGDDSN